RYEETPNQHLVERHQREIAPLLKNRKTFAESENFWLYDFWRDDGTVDENVFAWSNRLGDQRALIVYHNKYATTSGTLHGSAAKGNKSTGGLSFVKVHEALGLPSDGDALLAYQDNANGLHYLRHAKEIRERGLHLQLSAYQYHALYNWRELQSSDEYPWEALYRDLNGTGVWSLDEALDKFKLRPVHAALRRALDADLLRCYADLAEAEGESGEGELVTRAGKAPCGREETFDTLARRGERFFREAIASIEGKGAQPQVSAEGAKTEHRSTVEKTAATNQASDRFVDAQKNYRRLLEAAARVPALEKTCAHTWPPQARVVLPSYSPTVTAESVWAPVAAWCLISALAGLLPPER
ncbi:MAG TPA: hypothetical protein VMF89_12935, partial [Polyangiales bacterium]|nr:hypothetical protein [Polyangiales bacterium]